MKLLLFSFLLGILRAQITCSSGGACLISTATLADQAAQTLTVASWESSANVTCAPSVPGCELIIVCDTTFSITGGFINVAKLTITSPTVSISAGSGILVVSGDSSINALPTATVSVATDNYCLGGGYGGDPGVGRGSSFISPPQTPPYSSWGRGSAFSPADYGQAGAPLQVDNGQIIANYSGGLGGGVLKIVATSTTILGIVSARGLPGDLIDDSAALPSSRSPACSSGPSCGVQRMGSGSGGSIWITSPTFVLTGSVDASGANNVFGSAGGGGRIAIQTNSTLDAPTLQRITAFGGEQTASNSPLDNGAGAGTIATVVAGVETLYVGNTAYAKGRQTPLPATDDAGHSYQRLVFVKAQIRGAQTIGLREPEFLLTYSDSLTIDGGSIGGSYIYLNGPTITITGSGSVDASASTLETGCANCVPLANLPRANVGMSSLPSGGAGYGGWGAEASGSGAVLTQGQPYGNALAPDSFGAPGFKSASGPTYSPFKKAGGRVRIIATTCQFNAGFVSSNAELPAYELSFFSGGASGGSVWVTCTSLTVGSSTLFRANGGSATADSGGGSGGRLLVEYQSLSNVGQPLESKVQAWPGTGNTSSSLDIFSIKSGGFGTVVLNNNGSKTLYIGAFAQPASPLSAPAVTPGVRATFSTITLRDCKVSGDVKEGTDPGPLNYALSLVSSGTITISNSEIYATSIYLEAEMLSADLQSKISANVLGVYGNTSGTGLGQCAGCDATSSGGGGGGNGGIGAAGLVGTGGFTLTSNAIQPTAHGGNGADSLLPNGNTVTGARGGGNIIFKVNGTLNLDALVSADGGSSTYDTDPTTTVAATSGAGAGGSVWIRARNLTASSTNTISAKGGAPIPRSILNFTADRYGGSGGGGRVSIEIPYQNALPANFAVDTSGGSDGLFVQGQAVGGTGTFFLRTATEATLTIRNPTTLSPLDLIGGTIYPNPPAGEVYDRVIALRARLQADSTGYMTQLKQLSLDSTSSIQQPTGQVNVNASVSVDLAAGSAVRAPYYTVKAPTITHAAAVTARDIDLSISEPLNDNFGGSHAGRGGFNIATSQFASQSIVDPASAGQPAKNRSAYGGGVVRLIATTLTLSAAIDASGDSAAPAGAAGGSILLSADTLTLAGSGLLLKAQGGNSTAGGGGGGGRISIKYTATGPTWAVASTRLTAAGGSGSGGPDARGGAGTVAFSTPTSNGPLLYITDTAASSGTYLPDTVGSTFAAATLTSATIYPGQASTVTLTTTGPITATGTKTVAPAIDWNAGTSSITLTSSSLRTDGMGTGTGGGNGGNSVSAFNAASGGGHGGLGGGGQYNSGGSEASLGGGKGLAKQPILPGGNGGQTTTAGSLGGGVIRVRCGSLSLTNSNLTANGAAPIADQVDGTCTGGGAGGSIWITAATGSVTGSGLISASGGGYPLVGILPTLSGGPGGGGRIAIEYAGTMTIPLSSISVRAGVPDGINTFPAGPGTLWLNPINQPGFDRLIISNPASGPKGWTPLPDACSPFDCKFGSVELTNALIRENGAVLEIEATNITLVNTQLRSRDIELSLPTGMLNVDATSVVDASATANTTTGTPLGAATPLLGASHAGRSVLTSPDIYGDFILVDTYGSMGFLTSTSVAPALGGGRISIDAGGLNILGGIKANGGDGGILTGAASGGSLRISVGTLPITIADGAITANGGSGSAQAWPAGGGRIYFGYRTASRLPGGIIGINDKLQAYGGANYVPTERAGAGTVYKINLDTLLDELVISSGGTSGHLQGATTPLPTVGLNALTIIGKAHATAYPWSSPVASYIRAATLHVNSSTLETSGPTWSGPGLTQNTLAIQAERFICSGTSLGGILAPKIVVCAQSIWVDASCSFTAVAQGYGVVAAIAEERTPGGSATGIGGSCGTDLPQTPVATGPDTPGYAGTPTLAGGAVRGGYPGGVIILTASTITVYGSLIASGTAGVQVNASTTGSGGGGYIEINADVFDGTPTRISVAGGQSTSPAYPGAGGGAGSIVVNFVTSQPAQGSYYFLQGGSQDISACPSQPQGSTEVKNALLSLPACYQNLSQFCPRGTALSGPTCQSCLPGNFQNLPGQFACQSCPNGTATNISGTVQCPQCIAGTVAPGPGYTTCDLCTPGYEQPLQGQQICNACSPGSFAQFPGTTTCSLCSAGYVQPLPAQSTCTACQPGEFYNTTGGTLCSECPTGTYMPNYNASICTLCPAGYFSPTTKQLSCRECPEGTYGNRLGLTYCLDCGVTGPTYTDVTRSLTCTLCPSNTFVPLPPPHNPGAANLGADSMLDCLACNSSNTPVALMQCALWNNCSIFSTKCSGPGLTPFAPKEGSATWFVCNVSLLSGGPATDPICTPSVTIARGTQLPRTDLGPGYFNYSYISDVGVSDVSVSIIVQGLGMEGSPFLIPLCPLTQTVCIVETSAYTSVFVPSSAPPPESSATNATAAPPASSDAGGISGTTLIIAIVVPIVIVLIALIIVVLVLLLKRKDKNSDDVPLKALDGGRTEPPTAFQDNTQVSASAQMYGKLPPPSAAFGGAGGVVRKAKSYEIPYDELELQEEIGRGAYGIVYRGKWRDSDVAVKQLVFSHNLPPDLAEKEMETFLAEAAILKNLRPHANVLLFYGITPIPNLCIITEFLPGGSLWSLLCSNQVIEWTTVIKILKGIAAGMRHLHTEGVVHRDLAARNILLTASNDPKVADFGLSRTYVESGDPQHTKSDVGPVKWMAPESIRDREYSTKSDVWSYAVVIYEVLTRSEPFAGLDPIQVATRVVYENMRVPNPENAPPYLAELMDSCLQQNQKARPEFREIVRKLDR